MHFHYDQPYNFSSFCFRWFATESTTMPSFGEWMAITCQLTFHHSFTNQQKKFINNGLQCEFSRHQWWLTCRQYDGVEKESKKAVYCRVCVGLCMLILCLLVVAAGIALAAVFVPRGPEITLTYVIVRLVWSNFRELKFTTFSMSFCPAQNQNNTACCSGTSCSFDYYNSGSKATSYINILFTNKNLFNVTANQ